MLWWALVLNLLMFVIEIAVSWWSNSVALQADAIDFLGDGLNYGMALFALGLLPVWDSRIALVKGIFMVAFGLAVLLRAAIHYSHSVEVQPWSMGAVSVLALLVNLWVAFMLYQFRHGSANMRSVWLCSRNDALGNTAVIAAAALVAVSASNWPDVVVAAVMGLLAIHSGWLVVRQAIQELRSR